MDPRDTPPPVTAAVEIGPVRVGGGAPLALIAGPCVIESEELALRVAEAVSAMAGREGMGLIFKSSYAKENRGGPENWRGPGPDEGLRILERVRRETGVPVLSDVHCRTEVPAAAQALDVLQIPAYLCQQTELLLAAGRSGRAVNVKKGQFLSPEDMRSAVSKLESAGCRRILLTERGSCFGYGRLVADYRSLAILRGHGYPAVFDATHVVRLYGTPSSDPRGGEPQHVPALTRAAVAAGCDAVFLEVHPDPPRARCDAASMMRLEDLPRLLREVRAIERALERSGA